ncbi:hypothetical protein BDR26DRAFT_69463 [Obelidium mucronatum]|nr:hypothetical protein BDR26DRAFT_69463 [Obelidium mucronatum]
MPSLSQQDTDTLNLLLHIFGTLSAIACTGALVTVYRTPRLHTQVNWMICWFLFCLLVTGVSYSMGSFAPRSINDGYSSSASEMIPCTIQGLIVQLFTISGYLWDFLIALHSYWIITSVGEIPDLTKNWRWYHIYAWGTPIFTIVVLFLIQASSNLGPVMGDSKMGCWISNNYDIYRIYLYYLIIWSHYIILVGIYIAIYIKIAQTCKELKSTIVMTAKTRIIYKTTAIAIAFGIGWIPGTAVRIMEIADLVVPVWLRMAHGVATPSRGFLSSLIFLGFAFYQFKERASAGQHVEDDQENEFYASILVKD